MLKKTETLTSHDMAWPRSKTELNEKRIFTSHEENYKLLGLKSDGTPLKSEKDRKMEALRKLANECGYTLEDSSGREVQPLVPDDDKEEVLPFAGPDRLEGEGGGL